MNQLEMYKRLSIEDKSNLTIYLIYDSIFDVDDEEVEITDEVAMDIQELAYNLYLDDEYNNLYASQIAFFLAECYLIDNDFLEKIDGIDGDYILEFLENTNPFLVLLIVIRFNIFLYLRINL